MPKLKIYFNSLFFSIIAISFSACERDGATPPNLTNPVRLTILTPTNGDTVFYQENLIINGLIEYDFSLHGYTVDIVKAETNQLLFTQNRHSHGRQIDLWETWRNTIPENNLYTVKLTVHKDHLGNNDYFTFSVVGFKE
ncbi:MAG: hypothetical protein ACXITV_02265 [Luteibaculaceae bacterium]